MVGAVCCLMHFPGPAVSQAPGTLGYYNTSQLLRVPDRRLFIVLTILLCTSIYALFILIVLVTYGTHDTER